MGKIITIMSGKGGTGKTTIAGGLASCLAALGKRVLCIDADIGLRNLDIVLGLSDRAVMNLYDVIEGRTTLEEAAVEHPEIGGLFLLTAPVSVGLECISFSGMQRLTDLAREKFDYCFIDSPAGLNTGFRLAAAFCDFAIVVSTCDASSIHDAEQTAAALDELGKDDKRMIVNRVSSRLLDALAETVDDLMDRTGLPLLGLIPEDSTVTLAANAGRPLVLYTRKKSAVACLNIAKRVDGQEIPLMKIK